MKQGIQELAVFGGPRAFPLRAPRVGRPNSGSRADLLDRINQMLDNEWLSNMGPMMYEFEARVAELAGVRHCVSTGNATVALEMLIGDLATDAVPGDDVIVPGLTFPATAHAVRWRGLRAVFCDVDPVTGLIDPAEVERLITERTRAIIGVHLWGQACDVDRLAKIAATHQVRLFFDAAHALACTAGDRAIGGFGDAEVFSFHATKIVNCFEGGAIVTDDTALADRMRAERNFGYGADGKVRSAGTNGKLSEAGAAAGLTSLDALPEAISANRDNYRTYRQLISDIPGVSTRDYDQRNRNNHHYLIVYVDHAVTGLHRDTLLELLRAENIQAQPYFAQGVHQLAPYLDTPPIRLPNTEALCAQLLALPTGPSVVARDIEVICDVIRVAVARGAEVTARLRAQTAGVGAE